MNSVLPVLCHSVVSLLWTGYIKAEIPWTSCSKLSFLQKSLLSNLFSANTILLHVMRLSANSFSACFTFGNVVY